MFVLKKSTDPQLNIDDASRILENVFAKSQVEPNTIPLEVLTAYSNYRKERFSLQRTILVVAMVLFLMLPFLFIAPSFMITSETSGFAAKPVYQVEVDTILPVQSVTAEIDGQNIPVYETASHVYSIEPSRNGRMTVAVTLMNHQTAADFIDVENVDADPPKVISNKVDQDRLYLYLSDTDSGINYDGIRAVGQNGQEVAPESCNEAAGRVVFAYPKDTLNIYIPDNAENTLHLILSAGQ